MIQSSCVLLESTKLGLTIVNSFKPSLDVRQYRLIHWFGAVLESLVYVSPEKIPVVRCLNNSQHMISVSQGNETFYDIVSTYYTGYSITTPSHAMTFN